MYNSLSKYLYDFIEQRTTEKDPDAAVDAPFINDKTRLGDVVLKSNQSIAEKDIYTLSGHNWLNDEVSH